MHTVDQLLAVTASDEPRSAKAEGRDRALLATAADLRAFRVKDVARGPSCSSLYSAASLLVRRLHHEGLVRIVSAPGTKPYTYEWVGWDGPTDAASAEVLLPAREAEINRLRALVGEPPLSPRAVAS